jgi:hypothetical protein
MHEQLSHVQANGNKTMQAQIEHIYLKTYVLAKTTAKTLFDNYNSSSRSNIIFLVKVVRVVK